MFVPWRVPPAIPLTATSEMISLRLPVIDAAVVALLQPRKSNAARLGKRSAARHCW